MGPESGGVIRTGSGHLWVEDGIVRVRLTKSNPTLEDFKKIHDAGEELAGSIGKRARSVTDTGPVSKDSRDAWRLLVERKSS